MKRTLLFAAAAVALAGLAWAQARRPVNRKCPLKPSVRIDIAQTVIYNGKVVGLCCSDCTDKWKKNPAAYASALKEDANIPVEPEGWPSAKEAVEKGQNGSLPVLLFYTDKTPKSQSLLKVLSDVALEPEMEKVSYAKVEFKKDSEDAQAYKITAAPALVFIDPTATPPKVLKSLTTATPSAIAKEIADAIKKLEKK